jgi:hypothetical protein
MLTVDRGRFDYRQLNLDLRRRQERVVNQAVMHRSYEPLRLVYSERDGANNMNVEVAEPGRLFQFVGGYRNLNATLCEIARS